MTAEAIESSARRVSDLVRGVRNDQLAAPTPCERMSVGDLLDHIATFGRVFTGAAVKDPVASAGPTSPPSAADLDDAWHTTIPDRLQRLADAWSDPAAWTGTTHAGRLPATGELAGGIVLDELVVHGWDLARATGQPYDVDGPTLELVRAFIDGQVGDGRPIPREAVFSAAVAAADGAALLDVVVGLAGRDPSWSPGD